MLYFNSDYLEGAHPAVLQRLLDTNLEQTVGYGQDAYCAQAKDKIRAACHCPNAQVEFLVGGTQTNATVIRSLLRPIRAFWRRTRGTSPSMKQVPLRQAVTRC